MVKLLVVGLGGFVGAIARYGLAGFVHRYTRASFPFGTLVVNVLGCLVIGALMALVEDRQFLGPNARLFVLIGLLGSFTTFSTFGYETVELLREGSLRLVVSNIVGSVGLGVGAVLLGRAAVKLIGV